jgi:DNA-directed RNA polymerase specialized sigma subunit
LQLFDDPLGGAYEAFRLDPTPQNRHKVVRQLNPLIQSTLASSGSQNNPSLNMRAKLIVSEALDTYKPESGASLPSWARTQLQRLDRIRRETQNPVKIPDRAWLDNMAMTKAEKAFLAEHDREPDVLELSDRTGLSPERIQKVRQQVRKVAAASAFGDGSTLHSNDIPDYQFDQAIDMVYRDADRTDRQILEMRTGYGGKYQPMGIVETAQALGLDPSNVSRRAARMAYRIQEVKSDLEQVYGAPA